MLAEHGASPRRPQQSKQLMVKEFLVAERDAQPPKERAFKP
jgi:hypothetical protein